MGVIESSLNVQLCSLRVLVTVALLVAVAGGVMVAVSVSDRLGERLTERPVMLSVSEGVLEILSDRVG